MSAPEQQQQQASPQAAQQTPVAAFLLEMQAKISVYQLCIPLPPHCQPDPSV